MKIIYRVGDDSEDGSLTDSMWEQAEDAESRLHEIKKRYPHRFRVTTVQVWESMAEYLQEKKREADAIRLENIKREEAEIAKIQKRIDNMRRQIDGPPHD